MGAGQSASEMAARKREQARRLEQDAERWERGAEGERQVAALLDELPESAAVFHDLRVPGSRANIDHLIVAPGGVFVIDTKHFSNPVTVGRGRGAGRLWTGGRPIRLESTIWEAAEASRRLGVDVTPVLCVIAPSVPAPSFEFCGVRVCGPSRLLGELRRGSRSVDVERVTDHVQAMFGAPPDRAPSPPSTPTLPPPGVASITRVNGDGAATQVGRHRSARDRRSVTAAVVGGQLRVSRPLLRLLAVAVGLLVLLQVLPALSRTISGIMTAPLQGSVETSTSPATTTPPLAVAVTPRSVGLTVSCLSAGSGWTVGFEWPGEPPGGAAGYGLRWRLDDGPMIEHPGRVWSDAAERPTDLLVPNGAVLSITTDALDGSGAILGSATRRFAPSETC